MRILIVKTSSLGDIIHAFPILHFLHQEFQNIEIDWVVEKNFSEIVRAHPLVASVIEMDTRGWRKKIFNKKTWGSIRDFKRTLQEKNYDVVIDLQGNTKSSLPTLLAKSAHKVGFGLKTLHEWPNACVTHHRFNPPSHLNVRDENLYLVQHYFQRYSVVTEEKILFLLEEEHLKILEDVLLRFVDRSKQNILICPGSAWKNKQLSFEALEIFLSKILQQYHSRLIIGWGTAEELSLAHQLRESLGPSVFIFEKLPLPVLQNVMVHMDLVIAMDSLPLHLAGTSGTPTFSLFGASSAAKYCPKGPLHKSIQGTCPYGKIFERRCPLLRSCSTGLCIKGLSGEIIFEKFMQWKDCYGLQKP